MGEVECLSETKAIFSSRILGHCHEQEHGVEQQVEVGLVARAASRGSKVLPIQAMQVLPLTSAGRW